MGHTKVNILKIFSFEGEGETWSCFYFKIFSWISGLIPLFHSKALRKNVYSSQSPLLTKNMEKSSHRANNPTAKASDNSASGTVVEEIRLDDDDDDDEVAILSSSTAPYSTIGM